MEIAMEGENKDYGYWSAKFWLYLDLGFLVAFFVVMGWLILV
jgi:hypothetical protein